MCAQLSPGISSHGPRAMPDVAELQILLQVEVGQVAVDFLVACGFFVTRRRRRRNSVFWEFVSAVTHLGDALLFLWTTFKGRQIYTKW